MCEREQRGVTIAAVCNIVKKGNVWLVPSQSGGGKYTVSPDEQAPHCSCPDHETRGVICKHIFAVRCVMKRELAADGTETVTKTMTIVETVQRKTYPQKWAEYNAALTNRDDVKPEELASRRAHKLLHWRQQRRSTAGRCCRADQRSAGSQSAKQSAAASLPIAVS